MTHTPAVDFYYPNRMVRIMFQALEEIVGRNGVNAVLNRASLSDWIDHFPTPEQTAQISFETIARIHAGLEDVYGPRGGRGIALRTGRACFSYGRRTIGPELGLTEAAFRMLPIASKLDVGSAALANLFNLTTDQRVRVEHENGLLLWHIERCPLCWGRKLAEPSCHMAVGLLQEALYWVSGGKLYHVEETRCVACGDPACTIEIHLNETC